MICQWRVDQLFPSAFGQIRIFCDKIEFKIVLSSGHGVFFFSMIIFGKCGKRIFTPSDRKKKKREVSFTHEQNIICSLTQLDAIVHEQTIICGQLVICIASSDK